MENKDKKKDGVISFTRFTAPDIIKTKEMNYFIVPDNVINYLENNCSNKIIIGIYLDLYKSNGTSFNNISINDYASGYGIGYRKLKKYLDELVKLDMITFYKDIKAKNKLKVSLTTPEEIPKYNTVINYSELSHNKTINNVNCHTTKQVLSHNKTDAIKSPVDNQDSRSLNNNINNIKKNINNIDHDHILNSSVQKNTKTVNIESLVRQTNVNIESLVTSTKTLEKPYSQSKSKSLGCLCISREKKEEEEENMNNKDIREQYKNLVKEGEERRKEYETKNDEERNYNKEIEYWTQYEKRKNDLYAKLYNAIRPENKTIEIIDVVRTKKPEIHILNKELKNEIEKSYFCSKFNVSNNNFIYYYLAEKKVNKEITQIKFIYDNILIAYNNKVFSIDLYIEHIQNKTEHSIKPLEYKKKIIELIQQNDKTKLRKYLKKWSEFLKIYKKTEEDENIGITNTQKPIEQTENETSKLYWHYKHCPEIEMREKYDLSTLQNTYVIYYYMQRKTKKDNEKPFFYKGIMIQVGAEIFYVDNYLEWTDTQKKPIKHKPSFKDKLMKYVEKKDNEKLWNFYIGFQKYHEEIVIIPREQAKYKEKKQAENDTKSVFSQMGIDFKENTVTTRKEKLTTKQKTEYVKQFKESNNEAYKIVESEAQNIIRIERRKTNAELTPEQTIDIIYNQIKKYEKIVKKSI